MQFDTLDDASDAERAAAPVQFGNGCDNRRDAVLAETQHLSETRRGCPDANLVRVRGRTPAFLAQPEAFVEFDAFMKSLPA
jgi:hypothetical protein